MSKYCMLPYDDFWAAIDAAGAESAACILNGRPDTADGRRAAYRSLLASLRAKNLLCEQPHHKHEASAQ